MRVAQRIELSEKEVKTLTRWSRGRRSPTRLMKRAKIVLMAAARRENKTIAEFLGVDSRQVSRWCRRFVEKRLAGIEKDAARGGRKASKRIFVFNLRGRIIYFSRNIHMKPLIIAEEKNARTIINP